MKRLTALLLLLPIIASADPGAATKYLMNEPASLMDITFMRLNQSLDKQTGDLAAILNTTSKNGGYMNFRLRSYYHFDSDEIRIYARADTNGSASKASCKAVIAWLRKYALTWITLNLGHYGYESSYVPKNLALEIEKRTQLFCVIGKTGSPLVTLLEIRGMATETSIFVSEGPTND